MFNSFEVMTNRVNIIGSRARLLPKTRDRRLGPGQCVVGVEGDASGLGSQAELLGEGNLWSSKWFSFQITPPLIISKEAIAICWLEACEDPLQSVLTCKLCTQRRFCIKHPTQAYSLLVMLFEDEAFGNHF